MNEPQFEVEKLKELYKNSEVARAFLDHTAQRERNQSETKVDRILSVLANEGNQFSRGDVVELFRSLEELGCGQFVAGRRGWPSRFVWYVGMVSVGRAAAGEPQVIQDISAESADPESSSDSLKHVFHLRPEIQVSIDLPSDLSSAEAERLSSFIRTLPFEVDSEA